MKRFLDYLGQHGSVLFPFLGLIGLLLVSATLVDRGEVIVFFGEHRHPFLNIAFQWITQLGEVQTFIVVALFIAFSENVLRALLVGVTGLASLLLSFLLKQFFAMPRPALFAQQNGLSEAIYMPIEGVDLHYGLSSFPSGHTMGAFALFSFLVLSVQLPNNWKTMVYLLMPFLVALSRIYLVHHFLIDVAAGAVFGLLIGIMTAFLYVQLQERKHSWIQKKIRLG